MESMRRLVLRIGHDCSTRLGDILTVQIIDWISEIAGFVYMLMQLSGFSFNRSEERRVGKECPV